MPARLESASPVAVNKAVPTVAHLAPNPSNTKDLTLVAVCQRDHLRYDADHHRRIREKTRRAALANLEMFPEEQC
jgi:hypothetical protein